MPPLLKFIRLKSFDECYQNLDPQIQKKVDKTPQKYAQDNPGLHLEKIEGTRDIWSIRVDRRYRLSFQRRRDVVALRTVDKHNHVCRAP